MSRHFMRAWRDVMPYVSSLLILIVSLLYITYLNQRWCSLLDTMDHAYTATPPTTPTGQQLAKDIRGLQHDFHCK